MYQSFTDRQANQRKQRQEWWGQSLGGPEPATERSLSPSPCSSCLPAITSIPRQKWPQLVRMIHKVYKLSHFSRVWLCDPIDVSPPGSPVPGILQARTLEWVAISFSNAWKRKVKVKSLSRVWLLATPWTAAHQAPPSMGFSRQEYWSGVPLPSPPQSV